MELKRFIADNSREALLQVKQQHGEDALIISTNKVGKKTEVICAIEDSKDIEKDKHKALHSSKPEDQDSTKIDLAQRKTANKKEEGYRNEISNMEFSEQLGRIVSKSESKRPSKSPDVNELMKTIQEDLSDLRNKLEKQATTVTPISKARSALSAFSSREKFMEGQTQLADSIGSLLTRDLSKQQDWAGINIFFGMPGSGKSKTIESLISGLKQEQNDNELVVIEFIPTETELSCSFSNLMNLSQRSNIAYFREKNIKDLLIRLGKFDSRTCIFVETSYENLDITREIPATIQGKEIKQFLCLAADSSPAVLQNFVSASPNLLQSIIMTRMDLVADIDYLLPVLAEFSASISGVHNEGSKKMLASVDLSPENSIEKEPLSPMA